MRSVKTIKTLVIAVALPMLAGAATHRYIVELSSEPAVRYAGRSFGERKESLVRPEVQTYRNRIRAEQDRVGESIRAMGGTIVTRTDTASNTLIIDLPEEQAASLASVPGVKRYHPARSYRALLDQASVVHKMPQVYSQIGGASNAGAGIKIAIIDTGIDVTQPAFKDTGFQMPSGFPKVNASTDTKFTNNKVIVARSYYSLWADPTDPDHGASDESGHGTLTSSCAGAGTTIADVATFFAQANLTSPVFTGIAPGAWLGSYKVFGTPGYNDGATEAAILAAIDDAVKDGMDVINYSLGSFPPVPAAMDSVTTALNNAVSGGIIVTASAGNDGNGDDPGNPIDWVSADGYATTAPALVSSEGAMNVIQVGASSNSRAFGAVLTVGNSQFLVDGENALNYNAVGYLTFSGAPIIDVATLDKTGEACSSLPAGSLKGAIALIALSGYDINADTCDPDQKMDNALAAGAVAGIIYDDFPESFYDIYNVYTGFFGIDLLANTNLPGGFITYEDGVALQQQLANQGASTASLDFNINAVPLNSSRVAFLSSRGPNADFEIKPDLVAIGQDLLMATETVNPGGDFYDPTGVLYGANGTSASSPLVAGAAAVLKAARPGLSVAQYRSLLINSTAPIGDPINGGLARVMDAGSGLLDVNAALNAEATVVPASVSFGTADGSTTLTKTITITNSGAAADTFALTVAPRDSGFTPQLSTTSVQLGPGQSAPVTITIPGGVVAAGEYEGAIHIQGNNTATDTHVMYWLGVPSSTPYLITDFGFDLVSFFNRGALNKAAIAFRVTDASGIYMSNILSQVQISYVGTYNQNTQAKVTGNAKVGAPYYLTDVTSPSYSPGVIAADVTTSTARGVYDLFQVTVGDPNNPTLSLEFAIFGQ
jgi:subtilisin family serine protease